ncbi:unnamed protein product [Linum trigynum]|uniref:Uncharacterized protein n=1 Tax=Linum trigynum TaxID=586398 RepID=A0AAV2E1S5_9ROSI
MGQNQSFSLLTLAVQCPPLEPPSLLEKDRHQPNPTEPATPSRGMRKGEPPHKPPRANRRLHLGDHSQENTSEQSDDTRWQQRKKLMSSSSPAVSKPMAASPNHKHLQSEARR